MNVYKVETQPGTQIIAANHERFFNLLEGKPADDWKPMKVVLHSHDEVDEFEVVDFPQLQPGFIAMKQRAYDVLTKLELEGLGRFLELYTADNDPMWVWHSTLRLDCIDEANSNVYKFSGGTWREVTVAQFNDNAPTEKHLLFRVPQLFGSQFCVQPFVEAIEAASLTGLQFRKVGSV